MAKRIHIHLHGTLDALAFTSIKVPAPVKPKRIKQTDTAPVAKCGCGGMHPASK